jgi:N-hydroxyarylamine O-acetyltransferase
MTDAVDLDAYFHRIGYDGPREPTLAVLRALHARHPRAIPFENLDVLLNRPVQVDLASIQAKLVGARRGGYCFEHNGLFSAVLKALGFPVVDLAARVQWGRPKGLVGPRTHRVLRVETEAGPFQADVGFGGVTQLAPLRPVAGLEQDTGDGLFRFVAVRDALQLQFRLPSGWALVYLLEPTPQAPVDYELANWFVSTHPDSSFVGHLLAAWVGEDRRYALFDNALSVYRRDGGIEKQVLDAAELEALMHETFGLDRPGGAEALSALYERLCGGGAQGPGSTAETGG